MDFSSQSKQPPFKAVKEFKPESETELLQLEIIFAEITGTPLKAHRVLTELAFTTAF